MAQHSAAIDRVRIPPSDPSVGNTLELVQRVAVDRLRVLQLDLEERARAVARRTTWIALGAFFLVLAWIGLLGAAVVLLDQRLNLQASLFLVAASQVALGGGLIAWGSRSRDRR
jgi:hypothetical protein